LVAYCQTLRNTDKKWIFKISGSVKVDDSTSISFKSYEMNALRRVYTSGFCMCLLHCVAIFYYLPWLMKTKVKYRKSQRNAENAWGNRMCKLIFYLIESQVIIPIILFFDVSLFLRLPLLKINEPAWHNNFKLKQGCHIQFTHAFTALKGKLFRKGKHNSNIMEGKYFIFCLFFYAQNDVIYTFKWCFYE